MTEVLFWVATVPIVLFPLVYGLSARWWRTAEGRHEMTMGLALLGLVALGLLRRWLGDYPGHGGVVVAVYVAIAVAVWWRLILLVRVQIRARLKKGS